MKTLRLYRIGYTPLGTLGTFGIDGQTLYTLELPWNDNKPAISCIPEGVYECGPRRFNAGNYDAVEIKDVPNRSHILFHIANTIADLKGCVGVGSQFGVLKNTWAILNSKNAFNNIFMPTYGKEPFKLIIEFINPTKD